MRPLTLDGSQRRSANYIPNIWDFNFIQSLKSDYKGEKCEERAEKLKEIVRCMLNEGEKANLARLELIDSIQRLGLAYLFGKEIMKILDTVATGNLNDSIEENVYSVALRFRLLRQHGYEISQNLFSGLKDHNGSFKTSSLDDIKGMLSLYEASHLAFEGENILDEAREITTKYLNDIKKPIDEDLARQVTHSLELPLYRRALRSEARWYIEECSRKATIDPDLLEFAVLDFNMVQATYQDELKEMSRWSRDLGLSSRLSFARDRIVENFLWAAGISFEPHFAECRKGITKAITLIATIDDIYDVYGSLDELTLFTDTVERWDTEAMATLPSYMKICFLALYNHVNEMAYNIFRDQDFDIIPYLKQPWCDLCRAYLVEAKWYYNAYTPTFEKYLKNACISISGPLILSYAYILTNQVIGKEPLDYLGSYPDLIRSCSLISRLCDDLGTSTAELERGDVSKSIQCYMHETGVSERVAREHMKILIGDEWKKMNKYQVLGFPFSQSFVGAAVNLARIAECIYLYGDGYGMPDGETKDKIIALLVDPILHTM